MSLTPAQRRQTSEDLTRNLALSGLGRAAAAAEVGWTADRLDATLAVGAGVSPMDVWALRDHLDAALRHGPTQHGQGLDGKAQDAPRWTVLTDRARAMATAWFPLD